MSQLQALRIQLNFLRAYLFTCREPVIEELQKKLWPRDYLYEHVHLYSINVRRIMTEQGFFFTYCVLNINFCTGLNTNSRWIFKTRNFKSCTIWYSSCH